MGMKQYAHPKGDFRTPKHERAVAESPARALPCSLIAFQRGGGLLADDIAGPRALGCEGDDEKSIVRVVFLGTPLYAEPAETSLTLAYLNKGTTLEVLSDRGDFLQVRMHDSTVGYVRRSCAVAV